MKKSSHRAAAWSAVGFSALLLCGASCTGNIGEPDTTPDHGARTGGSSTGTGNGSGAGNGSATGTGAGGTTGTGTTGTGTTGTGTGTGGAGGTAGTGTGGAGGAGAGGAGGTGGVTPPPFEPSSARSAVRKVKGLLTGLAPTEDDVTAVTSMGPAGLRGLVNSWAGTPEFRERMISFFRNFFQQQGFIPTEDFKIQLLLNGGFDFNGIGTGAIGDDSYVRLVQNLEDMFAVTAWQLIADGKPFSEVLTTQRYMMTNALKSLYLQIEMPNDRARGATPLAWKIDASATPIPIEDTLNPASPNYMVFSDELPTTTTRTQRTPNCQGTAGMVNAFTGNGRIFQRLLGYVPNINNADGTVLCYEHAAKPYFTPDDVNNWSWVTLRPLNAGETRLLAYDLPNIRKSTELGLAIPRVGFYTTPSYLALWNTNDSNQHRVTANQTLLVALGQSFTSASSITPISTPGLDSSHSVTGTECYGCHKSLDPMRQFWATQYDYNDRNDFPARASNGVPANTRPTTLGGTFAFGNVNVAGGNMYALGPMLLQVADPDGISRFAIAVTQGLCFLANSSACAETDSEFRRIAKAFQTSNYNYNMLITELFTSPIVTALSNTVTSGMMGVTVSISRRDQLCSGLSTRLAKPDLCALVTPVPTAAQQATARIAQSLAADTFSRGEEYPITATDPTLFYRAASEMLCENIAVQAVDATAGDSIYKAASFAAAIDDMALRIMGYTGSDPKHAQAVQILTSHYNAVLATKASATNSLRSTFALACESPTSLSFGL
jgi:hypothetical protein